MDNLIGTMLGQYRVVEKIGQGGMAHVFKAYQPTLDRFVAIKVLSPVMAEEPGFIERFQREAQAVARMHHPNIVQVHDFGTQDRFNYLVMRYVENSITLNELIQGEISTDKLLDYIIQVADALNYAHERRMIHRDVKPSNILIDDKWALLSDFGLVKMSEASTQLTRTGTGMGTPAYMSPEQVNGSKVDHRTDIYALGIILYRVLTGAIPHDAPTPLGILAKRSVEPVPPLRQMKPNVSESLEHVTLKALAKEPEDRYHTATDFAEALKKAKIDPNYRELVITNLKDTNQDSTIKTPPPRTPLKRPGAAGKNLGLASKAGVGAIVITVLSLLAWYLWLYARQPTTPSDVQSTATDSFTAPVLTSATSISVSPSATSAPPTETPPPVPVSTPALVAKTDLEIWSGPGQPYELVGYLPEEARAEIVGRDKAKLWWQIRTSLTAGGIGWIRADTNLVTATNIDDVPIALAPPTPTGRATTIPTATAVLITLTPTSTATPTVTPTKPAATATATKAVTAPSSPPPTAASIAQFTLLKPISLDQPSFGPTEFQWQWTGLLQSDQGFEVRVWREDETPAGVHNAVEDNKNGNIVSLGNNTYYLNANIRDTFGVKGRTGQYLWTVALVQISPEYKDLGIQASPGRLRFEAGGSSGGGGGSSGGNGVHN
jgi:serine/threonine protein kinase